ncbi:double-strand break repair helicase AddA [Hyphomonas sp.]|uniref:double-strand break repair helicase AddA n=1 Tax=Hyphomonas sp. TaxID=87 RepID=UPI001E19D54E|nr:double-strand break repair helicase AddA [Hyphomonas sp.]MBU3919462.1 double-strand break repair helicase AddA [Alphaproteobacteria bacterium]MBU4062610.1 double-strand break repair helicase AddA [Alphaproteobacteria bacterium]MBU4163961.1 double-strand break repair helicase AddA [Alphaproteobacteria bacterium]
MTESAHQDALKQASHAQAIAANPGASAFATANAGSGKTKVLIDRVARLLLRRPDGRPGAAPDSILCITYTRAAASEMLTRLFNTLGKWAVMEDEPLRAQLAELEGRGAESYNQEQLKAARALFARALETPGGLRIETIHAFCARVLRRFPLEAGVVPGFVELEEDDAREIWQQARDRAILRAVDDDPDALALISRDAGRDGASSALDSLKGSGSKLRAFAAECDDDPARMEAALRVVVKPPGMAPDALVHAAMGAELPVADLKRALAALGSGKPTDQKLGALLHDVLAAGDRRQALELYKSVFFTAAGLPRAKNPYTKGAADAAPIIADLFAVVDAPGRETLRIRTLLDDLKRAEVFARTTALLKIGIPALAEYDASKVRRGALDFDDLIEKTRDLLASEGLSNWVLYKLDGGLSHVLLDEAQDTSPAQWELIGALTQEFTAGEGRERLQDPRTLFMVGDDKQSIYAFQGADPARFLEETQSLTQRDPNVAQADMRMSFRSSPEILSFVDTVWNEAPVIDVPFAGQRPMTADRIAHTARRWNEPGFVEMWPVVPKDPEPETDAWARPLDTLRVTSPKVKLAQALARSIKEMVSGAASVWEREGVRRAARPGDILVLVRERRGGLFEAVISALKSAGVPVAGADRLRLAEYIGVQDCLNLMRFAVLPQRDLTLAEILRGPFCGLVDDDRYLFPLATGRKQGESLWSRVVASEDAAIIRTRAFLEGLIARAALPPFEFLSSVLDLPDDQGQTGWEKVNARLGTPARDPVEALLSRALAHDSSGPSSLQLFVAALEFTPVEIKRDLAAAGNEVRVMTVHGAKGLQAPIVILPDTTAKPKLTSESILSVDGALLWSPRKDTDIEPAERARLIAQAKAREEHRRLLYVALTRAQDRLLIAGHWYGGDGDGTNGYHDESWYALCRNAMELLPATESEDGAFRFGELTRAPHPPEGRIAAVSGLPEWAQRPPEAEPEPRRLTAPTSLLGPKTRVVAPFDPKREARLKRGRLIHALLQYLPELPHEARTAAGERFLVRDQELTKAQRTEMLRAAAGILNDPALSELFAPGGRAEAAIIGTSTLLPSGMIINGRVDRLVVTPTRVLVIDFKTDQPAPENVEDVPESYVAQMAAYWAVLSQAYSGREIWAVLCWTDGPRMMRIPDAMLSVSLNNALRAV